ncbi:MAG: hypothetical protein NC095_01265 [Muribaculum sp.]|nr:hypothetical protein [Muribaculum sp.]
MTKKIFKLMLSLISMVFIFGSHSLYAQEDVYGDEVKLTEAEKYALKEPGKRASGKGVSQRENAAMSRARAEARAAFAEAISASVLSAIKAGGIDILQTAGDENEGHESVDGGEKQNNLIKSVAQQVIEGSPVVKTNKYYDKKTRNFTIFVCLEYNGDVSKLAKEVVQGLKQKVSDEDRLKIEYNLDKFEKEIEKQLNGEGEDVEDFV